MREMRPPLPQETVAIGQPLLHCNHMRLKGDQKCPYVGGDATGLRGMCHSGVGEITEKAVVAHVRSLKCVLPPSQKLACAFPFPFFFPPNVLPFF